MKMAETKKKENIFKRIGKWFRGMKSELKKVVWPTASQVFNNTLVVIVCSIIVALIVFAFDWLAGLGIHELLKLVG